MRQRRVPIAEARNLGPVTADEMASMDVYYLDQIIAMGWEEFCTRYTELFPHRLNLNAFTAIIGAVEDRDWREIDPATKLEAKKLIQQLKKTQV